MEFVEESDDEFEARFNEAIEVAENELMLEFVRRTMLDDSLNE